MQVAGAGGPGHKFSGCGFKKTVPRRALLPSNLTGVPNKVAGECICAVKISALKQAINFFCLTR